MTTRIFTKTTNLSRRKFIIGSAAAASGGLALGFNLPFGVKPAEAQSIVDGVPELNAWVLIKPDELDSVLYLMRGGGDPESDDD